MKQIILLFLISQTSLAADEPNRALDWLDPNAQKIDNTQMFESDVQTNSVVNGAAAVNQNTAFTSAGNVLQSCVSTIFSGRKDSICAQNPDHPECTGLNNSLQNSTTCAVYQDAAKTICLSYGAKGYSGTEWVSFSTQYASGVSDCNNTQSNSNLSGKSSDLKSIAAQNLNTQISAVVPTSTAADSSTSNQFGFIGPGKSEFEGNDGAVYLGLENGEIYKNLLEGKDFIDILASSPFFSKLSTSQKPLWESAVTNANSIVDELKKRPSYAMKSQGAEENKVVGIAAATNATKGEKNKVGALEKTESEVLDLSLPYYNLKKETQLVGKNLEKRNPASIDSSMEKMNEQIYSKDESLFERVTKVYKRKTETLQQYSSSKISDEIRALNEPEL